MLNNLEGGTDGTVMTTANTSVSGDAASVIVSNGVSASGAFAYRAASAAYGSMGGRITLAAATSYWRQDMTLATGRWVVRRTFVAQTVTSGLMALASIYTTGTLMGQVRQTFSTNLLRCGDSAGDIPSASDSPVLTMGNKYLIELAVTEGGTTSTGRIEIKVWNVADGTVFHTYDSGTTRNTGTIGANRCRLGGGVTGQGWTVDDFDELRFEQLASGWFGPPGTNYTDTPSDNAGATDAVNLVQGRSPSDNAGAMDVVSLVQGGVRAPADPAGATETVALSWSIVLADSAGASDAASAEQSYSVTVSDSAGVYDTGQPQQLTLNILPSDVVGVTDEALTTPGRTLDDVAGATDATNLVAEMTLGLDDAVSATDSFDVTRSALLEMAEIELVTGADDVTFEQGIVVPVVVDTADATDLVEGLLDVQWLFADTADATDLVEGLLDVQWLFADMANTTDTVASLQGFVVGPADIAGAVDSALTVQGMERSVADNVSMSDSVSIEQQSANSQTVADSAGILDSASFRADRFLLTSDSVPVTDSVVFDLSRSVDDTADAVDAVSAVQGVDRAAADSAALSDSASAQIQSEEEKLAEDAASATDSVVLWSESFKVVSDAAAGSDSVSLSFTYGISVEDTAGGTDSISQLQTAYRSLSDPATTTDAVSVELQSSTDQVASDSAALSDAIQVLMEKVVTASDLLNIIDEASRTQGKTLSENDSAGGTDTVDYSNGTNYFFEDLASAGDFLSYSTNGEMGDFASASDSASWVLSALQEPYELAFATDEVWISLNVYDDAIPSFELSLQRRLTEYFIFTQPVTVNLVPRSQTRTSAGGFRYTENVPRGNQVMRLVEPSMSGAKTRAEHGVVRDVQFILLGRWNAQIGLHDVFELQDHKWEVESLMQYNGYERRATVIRHGD